MDALKLPVLAVALILSLVLWDAMWKAVALWKSARNNQIGWFITLIIINSAGILPILYIAFFQNRDQNIAPKPSSSEDNQ